MYAKLLQINISLELLNFYLCFHSAQENKVGLIYRIYILPRQLKQQSRFRGEEKGGLSGTSVKASYQIVARGREKDN